MHPLLRPTLIFALMLLGVFGCERREFAMSLLHDDGSQVDVLIVDSPNLAGNGFPVEIVEENGTLVAVSGSDRSPAFEFIDGELGESLGSAKVTFDIDVRTSNDTILIEGLLGQNYTIQAADLQIVGDEYAGTGTGVRDSDGAAVTVFGWKFGPKIQ